jgi:hypothetical protein
MVMCVLGRGGALLLASRLVFGFVWRGERGARADRSLAPFLIPPNPQPPDSFPLSPTLHPPTHTGFGDADNIPSRLNLHLLRHCELNASAVSSVDIGGWMPWGNMDEAYKPDHNVGGRSWSYADPTYWCVCVSVCVCVSYVCLCVVCMSVCVVCMCVCRMYVCAVAVCKEGNGGK